MKKHRIRILLVLYGLVFIVTIRLEMVSILNTDLRLLVNISTLCMLLVSGLLFYLLYSGAQRQSQKEQTTETKENKIPEETKAKKERKEQKAKEEKTGSVFDKANYLAFANHYELTRREIEIGLLVMNGYSNMQIAETLYIAETTVKKHLSNIYEKTQVSGRKMFRERVNNWRSEDRGTIS